MSFSNNDSVEIAELLDVSFYIVYTALGRCIILYTVMEFVTEIFTLAPSAIPQIRHKNQYFHYHTRKNIFDI